MTTLLLVIGCLGIARDNKQALSAVVALMAIWGFLVRHAEGEIFSAPKRLLIHGCLYSSNSHSEPRPTL